MKYFFVNDILPDSAEIVFLNIKLDILHINTNINLKEISKSAATQHSQYFFSINAAVTQVQTTYSFTVYYLHKPLLQIFNQHSLF